MMNKKYMLKITKMNKKIEIILSEEELSIINNAINETLNFLGNDSTELEIRIGTSKQKIEELLSKINLEYHKLALDNN